MSAQESNSNTANITLIAMVMLRNKELFNYEIFMQDIGTHTTYQIGDDRVAESNNCVLDIDGETVVIIFMPMPIPWGDIESTAKYAYNWAAAENELAGHEAHIIVSFLNGSNDSVKRFSILTAVTCAIIRTHNSIGVYKGAQSLLIPAKQYLAEVKKRNSRSQLPLNLWLYFGLRTIDEKHYGYTYGLTAFDKKEMEITASKKELLEIREFLYNIAHYLIENNVSFEDGQTCSISEKDVVTITLAKGQFNEGEVFRLGF